jgi:hypothetical protein
MYYHELAVGTPFDPSLSNLPEGNRLMVADSLVLFASFRDQPDRGEIEAVRHGRCEFFLWSRGSQIVICLHCRSSRGEFWADAPFDVRGLQGEEGHPAPLPPAADQPAFGEAIVVLSDARSGVVAAVRALSLSDHFMRSLTAAVYRQSLVPLDEAEAQHDMLSLYARYPTAERFAQACEIRCEGRA